MDRRLEPGCPPSLGPPSLIKHTWVCQQHTTLTSNGLLQNSERPEQDVYQHMLHSEYAH